LSPGVAAALSFLLPGLGQLAVGALRRGLLLLLPLVAIAVFAVVVSGGGIREVIDLALSNGFLTAFLIVNLLIAAWRIFAIIDAERTAIALEPAPRRPHRVSTFVVIALVIATIGMHGAVEVVGYQTTQTLNEVFVPAGDDQNGLEIPEPSFEPDDTPEPTPTPTQGATPSPVPTATPVPTPSPTPGPKWAKDGRLNLLLIGSDGGPGRWSLRTDTMIVLSVDQATGRAAMFGIPRNMTDTPLAPESRRAFPNGRFPGLLNALYVYATGHPASFPGTRDTRGFRAVTGAVQQLVGVKLDGAVVINLNGFVDLVDAIGGLWIDVPTKIVDNHYPQPNGRGKIRIVIKAGCQKLKGLRALEYARSRHQDSDYGRMKRQQAVLLALAHQVDPIEMLPKVPELLKIAGKNFWTTLDRKDIAGLAALAARIDPSATKTTTFTPPKYPSHMTTYWIKQIRKVVRGAFDGPAPKPKPSPTGTEAPVNTCRG